MSGRPRHQPRTPARPDPRSEIWLTGGPARRRPRAGSLKVALCYPAPYSLGMSNLGFHAALGLFQEQPNVHCERAFLERDGERAGRSFESGTPLSSFDVLAFSVSFENDFLGLARVLSLSGIALDSSERSEADPLVVMGGILTLLNPEPVAPLLDAVLVGDAEAIVPPFVASLTSGVGGSRTERVSRLVGLPGVYVPHLYDVERDEAGGIRRFRPSDGAPLPVAAASAPEGGRRAQTVVLSHDAEFRDMFLVEITRGCRRACRFCAAGHLYGSPVHRSAEEVLAAARAVLPTTRRVGLVAPAPSDHPDYGAMLAGLRELGVELNVASLRAENIDEESARLMVDSGVKTVTLAPETGSEDLRKIIGKPLADESVLAAAELLASAGVATLKLYFMIGLPGETERDIEAIVGLVRRVRAAFVGRRRGARVTVSASVFVPKPRTPFQWLPMAREKTIRARLNFLRRSLGERPRIRFVGAGPREARKEGVLARGGRELSRAVVLAGAQGVPWKAALKRAGVDPASIVDRVHREEETFPWELIEAGEPRSSLLSSYRVAMELLAGRPGPRGT